MKLRDSDLTWQETDEEIILDPRASSTLKLTGSGAHLWKELERGSDVDSLVDSLVGTYEIDPTTARGDVDAFPRRLKGADLLAGQN